jgi:hypothetical protein
MLSLRCDFTRSVKSRSFAGSLWRNSVANRRSVATARQKVSSKISLPRKPVRPHRFGDFLPNGPFPHLSATTVVSGGCALTSTGMTDRPPRICALVGEEIGGFIVIHESCLQAPGRRIGDSAFSLSRQTRCKNAGASALCVTRRAGYRPPL